MSHSIPTGIVFVNNDLTESVRNALVKQLFISEIMDGYTFDQTILNNSNYPTDIHNNNGRVMVVRSFKELDNRDLADVVIFVTHGTANIEKNKYGPHGSVYRVAELSWQKLCVFRSPQSWYTR
jgi:hypothetical protein